MYILVSFCNVIPGAPTLGLLDSTTLQFQVVQPSIPEELRRCVGITGLATAGRYLYAVVQEPDSLRPNGVPGPPSLLIMNWDLQIVNHYIFRWARDVHSICVRGDELYAVSTGTDEVIKLELRGTLVVSETVYWRPVPGGSREDVHHLNSIGWSHGSLLVSGLGRKSDGFWSSAKEGFIVDIIQSATVACKIYHPHSLLELAGVIAYCESSRMSVRTLGSDRVQTLPGYTRGLCLAEGKIYVGTSIGREISKSTGIMNNPTDPGTPRGQCSVVRLSPDDLSVEQTIDLTSYAREIYDLLPIQEIGRWPIVAESVWRDRTIRELESALDERTAWSKRAASEVIEREARLRELQRQLQADQQDRDNQGRELQALQQERDALREGFRILAERIESLEGTLEAVLRGDNGAVKQIEYRRLVTRVRDVVRENLPIGATVLVVSKGDEQLTQLEGRQGWHFPQDVNGAYSGFTPADSGSAVVQLEAMRAKGAEYLVFPSTSLWWLEHYSGLREYLDRQYRLLLRRDDTCTIYALREPTERASPGVWAAFEDLLSEVERRCEREPAILDWGTGLDLAARFSRRAVFSPIADASPAAEPLLPYLDGTVDVVAIASAEQAVIAEARRVAQVAVVVFARSNAGTDATSDDAFSVQWVSDMQPKPLPSTSIIIPSYNGIAFTEACIRALQESLPLDFRGEIIVVDDASTDDTPFRMQRLAEQDPRIKSIRNPQNVGFLSTCNRGAELADGDILVFLNNDTLPQPGWLEALLKIFEDHADAGAVGGKLVYPDGRLQEAGGVIFSDGSAANFGRGDFEIDAPLYNYVREVDYVTGALIATPRALFEKLGGLDARYRPIYYEETDYCFRVREMGLKVYYQPASVVIHLEGVTCGTDPSGGQKRFQVVNRQKFTERWREALRRQPDNPNHFDSWTWYGLAVREEREPQECEATEVRGDGSNGQEPHTGNGRRERAT